MQHDTYPAECDYLASQPLGRLATRRLDGSLQDNPVGFSYDEQTGIIDIIGRGLGATRKFHNVAASCASRGMWIRV